MLKKAKKTGPRILPRKMSALIKIALADIRKAEKAEDMIIDMNVWFEPAEIVCRVDGLTNGGVDYSDTAVISRTPACIVCAAGSVMRYSLEADITDDSVSTDSFPGNKDQLYAIDYLRSGEVLSAAIQLGLIKRDVFGEIPAWKYNKFSKFDTHIPGYWRSNPEPFHKTMEKLRQKLIKAGL